MKKYPHIIPLSFLFLAILACNFDSSLVTGQLPPATAAPAIALTVPAPDEEIIQTEEVSETEEVAESEEVPVLTPTEEGDGKLDPCTLITAEQAETILGEPVTPAEVKNGSCVFSNAKDKLYMVNIAAAQDKETAGILQGQAILLMFTGNPVSDDLTAKLKNLSDEQNYKGFFTALATASKGSQVMTAKLFTGGGHDLVYWAWINAPPRRQGAFVAVRKNTLVNINVVLTDTADSSEILKALNTLAGDAFAKLPEEFSIGQPVMETSQANSAAAEATPTLVPDTTTGQSPAATPTLVPVGLSAPILQSPADGSEFDIYPRVTTLKWQAVDGAAGYLLEIMACSSSNPANCFSHPMIEQTSRETAETEYTFNFIGAQPGKWRVMAIDSSGKAGVPSDWWTFSYKK